MQAICQLTGVSMNDRWISFVHSRLVPATCVLCSAPGHNDVDLCRSCAVDLPWLEHACSVCAAPLPTSAGEICGACLTEPPPFSRTCAAFRYEEPVRRLVQELKFRNKLHLARLLGQLMGSRLAAQEAGVELIIPVPLHRKRLCERGYNQALELAHAMAKQLNVPIDMESCVRTRATAAQSELSSEQRQKNVRGVFSLRKPIAAKTVAIVDDVMTTGATVTELARVLRQSGVQEVQVWVCARAPL